MWQRLTAIPRAHPFAFAIAMTTAKTGSADLWVQKFVEKREEIDWRRNGAFVAFAVSYLGAWQYALFVKIMPRLVPGAAAFAAKGLREKWADKAGLRGLVIQNFVENGINNPILFFPIFYTIKEFIEGGPLEDGIKKYRANFREDLCAIWSVWVPAQFINFAFSPLWFRVPFVALVSMGWTAFVSFKRGQRQEIREEDEAS